jgi:hypothetical protein
MTRRHRGFTYVHPSGLPQHVTPGWNGSPWALPRASHPRSCPRRTPRRGRSLRTGPGHYTFDISRTSFGECRCTHATCVSHAPVHQLACTEVWTRRRGGPRVGHPGRWPFWPQCDEPLSTVQSSPSMLAYGSVLMTWSTRGRTGDARCWVRSARTRALVDVPGGEAGRCATAIVSCSTHIDLAVAGGRVGRQRRWACLRSSRPSKHVVARARRWFVPDPRVQVERQGRRAARSGARSGPVLPGFDGGAASAIGFHLKRYVPGIGLGETGV